MGGDMQPLFKSAVMQQLVKVGNKAFKDTFFSPGRWKNIELVYGSETYGVGKHFGNTYILKH